MGRPYRYTKLSGDWAVLSALVKRRDGLGVADIHRGTLRRLIVLEWAECHGSSVLLMSRGRAEYERLKRRAETNRLHYRVSDLYSR